MFIGQNKIVERMRMWLYAAQAPPNLLLRGQFGSGKTTLAQWYAYQLDERYYYHVCFPGPSIYPPPGGVVVLDEIHNLRPEEAWYQFPGVLVGCTTEGAPLSAPLQSRFIQLWMEAYSENELAQMVQQVDWEIDAATASVIASRSRGVPRTAIQVAREYATATRYYGYWPSTDEERSRLLASLGVYERGYTDHDRRYLDFVQEHGPVSLRNIAASLNLPEELVREEVEPFLMQLGLIKVTQKGRYKCGE